MVGRHQFHPSQATWSARNGRSCPRFSGILLSGVLLLALTPATAAAACNATAGRQQAALERQVAALQRIERQRQCSAGIGGGLFNACRDLALRRQAAMAQLNAARGGSDCVRAASRKASPKRPQRQARTAAPRQAALSTGQALYCVRLADGYYFPAPQSQYATSKQLADVADQCRFICNSPDVVLYRLPDFSMETEEMVSVEGGRPYRELPAAFQYRSAEEFAACDQRRYQARVVELRARTVTPGNLANAQIPLPTFRPAFSSQPAEQGSDERHASAAFEAPPEGVSLETTASIRKVRIVMPARIGDGPQE